LTPLRIVRVLASVRIPAVQGPDADYELLHAVIQPASGPERESLLLRSAGAELFEIRIEDLAAFELQGSRFIQDVLWRLGQGSGAGARAAKAPEPPVISASGGRTSRGGFTPAAPAEPAAGPAPLISAGPKRRVGQGPPPGAGGAPPPPLPDKPFIPDAYRLIAFPLSRPPSADEILEQAKATPKELLVVASTLLAGQADAFIQALKRGEATMPPHAFTALLIRRMQHGRPVTHKAIRAELAGALVRASADFSTSVWILPE
jgi:hypothetical protein